MTRSYLFEDRTRSSRRKDTTALSSLRSFRRNELRTKRQVKILDVPQIVNFAHISTTIFSPNLIDVYNACVLLRKSLSREDDPPIQSVLDSGIVSRVIELVSNNCSLYESVIEFNNRFESKPENADQDKVGKEIDDLILSTRVEAAWILTNLASGTTEQTLSLIDFGTVKVLCACLSEDSFELVDQCIWALGNISGDVEQLRDIIIEQDCANKIVNIIQLSVESLKEVPAITAASSDRLSPDSLSPVEGFFGDVFADVVISLKVIRSECLQMVRNSIWLLSNLCRGSNPSPELNHLVCCYNAVKNFVFFNDADILNDALWCLSYICDANEELCRAILNSKIVVRVVTLLKSIVASLDDSHSQQIDRIQHQSEASSNSTAFDATNFAFGVPRDYSHLPPNSDHFTFISPLLRIIGNICTGDDSQTVHLFQVCALLNFDLLYALRTIFYKFRAHKKSQRIRKEICWILSNLSGTDIAISLSAKMLHDRKIQSTFSDSSRAESGTLLDNFMDSSHFTKHSIIDYFLSADIVKVLTDALHFGESYVKEEAIWAIHNLSIHKKVYQHLGSKDILTNLIEYIDVNDNKHDILHLICIFFKRILTYDKQDCDEQGIDGILAKRFKDLYVVDSIESIGANEENTAIVKEILDEFFDGGHNSYEEYDYTSGSDY